MTSPTTLAQYRERLIELYTEHNPANVARVDYLLAKYKNQEEFLYRSVCSKYKKEPEDGGKGIVATRPKAGLPVRTVKSASPGATNGAAVGTETILPDPHLALLATIDLVLLGGHSGFFDRAIDDMSGGSDHSSASTSESGSRCTGDTSSEDGELDEANPRRDPRAVGTTAVPKPSAGATTATPPPLRAAVAVKPPDLADRKRQLESQKLTGGDTAKAAPPPLRRAPPPLSRPPPLRDKPGKAAAPNAVADDADDDDMDDEALAAMLGAKLHGEQQPGSERSAGDQKKRSVAEANHIPPPVKSKPAWGAPPPLRAGGRRDAKPSDEAAEEEGGPSEGAKPKAPPRAVPDIPAPALFDQWLACLKFVTGWNDQSKHTDDEIKEAFREHLRDEGIDHGRTVGKLCGTIVPLLLDLRRIDEAVVKNLRQQVLRGLKIVQVCILRIVTFELFRERDMKEEQKRKGRKADPKSKLGEGVYLASDINALAKVVGHFRFDRTFSEGLHQLILGIRRQKRPVPGAPASRNTGAVGPAPKKRSRPGGAAEDNGGRPSGAPPPPPLRKRPRT